MELEPFEKFALYIRNHIAISDSDLHLIRSFSTIRKLRKKQFLLQEGDNWKLHAFITKGCMRVYSVDAKGTEHVLSFAVENWWTGDRESLMSGEPSKLNIDAVEDSEMVIIRNDDFDELCKQIPLFNKMINDILQRSFNTSQKRIQAAISFTAEEKYLNFLEKYPSFVTRIPQSMIASYLGISAETLSRVRGRVSLKD